MNVKVLDQGLEPWEDDEDVGVPVINNQTDTTTEDPDSNNKCIDNHPIQPASRIQKNHPIDNFIGQLNEGVTIGQKKQSNDVWELVPRPKDHNIIGTKWIFKNKSDELGVVTKNKARLVEQGYSQVEGVDFEEIFDTWLD
ncbi:hypothetical protein LIER_37630 [Lithospermum erythrorhizon]|uniref:Reverse transcriptase Ty1/copia-type domain-containing protein n=1 Tax=Lithospermum erythrorhizon TaxID=34254 RepID=A0AAV3PTD9_LITER